MKTRARLRAVAGNALRRIAIEVAPLLPRKARVVEAVQVFPGRAPRMDMAGMFGKEAQEGIVPEDRAIPSVEQAHGHVHGIQKHSHEAVDAGICHIPPRAGFVP